MRKKPIAIDDLSRDDHYFLEPDDECIYFGDYTAGVGYQHSSTNQLIYNLKKGVEHQGEQQYEHKIRAIQFTGKLLNSSLGQTKASFIAVPPSKSKADPLYDNRLAAILGFYNRLAGNNIHVVDAIETVKSTEASHLKTDRPSIDELIGNYSVDADKLATTAQTIVIFDDMLTTGRHFKAIQKLLNDRLADRRIIGVFIARRVPNPYANLDL